MEDKNKTRQTLSYGVQHILEWYPLMSYRTLWGDRWQSVAQTSEIHRPTEAMARTAVSSNDEQKRL